MPREAPVTIATLLLSLVIFSLLCIVGGTSAWDGRKMNLFTSRIIGHNSASQSGKREQFDGPFRCYAGVHTCGGAAQLHARGRGPRPAALDGDRRGEATRSAARRAAPAADDAPCQPNAGRRGISPALPHAYRR